MMQKADYFLFFATNSRKGLQKMKESMWKVDPGGEFRFSDATNPDQALLFEKEPNLPALRGLLVKRFTGLEVEVNQIEEFVVDATPFHSGHYKRVLRDVELATPPGLTPVNPSASRRKERLPTRSSVFAFRDAGRAPAGVPKVPHDRAA